MSLLHAVKQKNAHQSSNTIDLLHAHGVNKREVAAAALADVSTKKLMKNLKKRPILLWQSLYCKVIKLLIKIKLIR